METTPKDRDCGSEKASRKGVTAKGVLSDSKKRGCKGDSWN
jgi:hypothetical protein